VKRRRATSRRPAKAERAIEAKRAAASNAVRNRRLSTLSRDTEVARLTRERDEAREQQKATAEILRLIASSPGDLQRVFDIILANAVRLCEAKFGNLSLREGDAFRIVAMHGATPAWNQHVRERPVVHPPHPDTALGRVVRTHKVSQITDLAAQPDYIQRNSRVVALVERAGARSILGVPLLRKDDLVGVIVVYRHEVSPFTGRHVELVRTFASQAVIAIENTRLLNELRQRTDDLSESLQQQTATADVLKVISSSPGSLEPVFEAMLVNATRLCEAKFGVLYLHEAGAARIVASHNVPRAFSEARRRRPIQPPAGGPLDELMRTKQTVQVPDLAATRGYAERHPAAVDAVELGGVRTTFHVPMLKDNELIGHIAIFRQEIRPFTDKQTALVQSFAAQAVIAIENARLLNELRESLQQQTATADVLGVISSSPGKLEPVFETMLANAVRLCEAKFGTLFRCEGKAFRWAAGFGTPPDIAEYYASRGLFEPTRGTHFDRVIRTKRISHGADYPDAVLGGLTKLGGARSIVVVPMLKEDALLGAIGIYRQEAQPFTDKQIALVQNFANQAVIAIENARLLNELRESLQQQTSTADVLKVISRSTFNLQTDRGAALPKGANTGGATLGGAAMRVPARIITSGPTASDPTSSVPLPPAATPCLLYGTSSYSQVMNSRSDRVRGRQSGGDLFAGARRSHHLCDRRRGRRQDSLQGRPRHHALRPSGHQQGRSGAACRRLAPGDGTRRQTYARHTAVRLQQSARGTGSRRDRPFHRGQRWFAW
jgi:GAF domain-containing protein